MAKDIILTDNDLDFYKGDLIVAKSDAQHIEHILIAQKGDYKQNPLTGVGIFNYLKAPFTSKTKQAVKKELTLQLKSDKAKDIKVSFNQEKLEVQALYED